MPVEHILLDTNIVSYTMKSTPDTRAELYRKHLENKVLAICFTTVSELLYWGYHRNWGAARFRDHEKNIQEFLVIPYDIEIARTHARLRHETNSKGNKVSERDLWIAASAVRHKIPLVTHNHKDFYRIPGLLLISEQDSQLSVPNVTEQPS